MVLEDSELFQLSRVFVSPTGGCGVVGSKEGQYAGSLRSARQPLLSITLVQFQN